LPKSSRFSSLTGTSAAGKQLVAGKSSPMVEIRDGQSFLPMRISTFKFSEGRGARKSETGREEEEGNELFAKSDSKLLASRLCLSSNLVDGLRWNSGGCLMGSRLPSREREEERRRKNVRNEGHGLLQPLVDGAGALSDGAEVGARRREKRRSLYGYNIKIREPLLLVNIHELGPSWAISGERSEHELMGEERYEQVSGEEKERRCREMAEREYRRIMEGTVPSSSFPARLVFNKDATLPESSDAQPPLQALLNWKCLVFASDFECGNLRRVVQVGEHEYDLLLSTDTKTRRHVQWFFFRISGTERGVEYKLNIINMRKHDSLFNYGLKPVVLSVKRLHKEGVGWHHAGKEVAYYRSSVNRSRSGRGLHTLTFSLSSPIDNDCLFVAHSYPYSTSDLTRFLAQLEKSSATARYVSRSSLCRTVGQRECPRVTITEPTGGEEARRRRKTVFISSRVHPGETPASWVMHGILEFLTGQEERARRLREEHVFELVPMVNVDGVAAGNCRTSLEGEDMNRCWGNPSAMSCPEIGAIKGLLRQLQEEGRPAILFLDLHAHSRQLDCFVYGCESRGGRRREGEEEGSPFDVRVFPAMVGELCEGFNFSSCSFNVGRGREGCARVVAHRELGILGSYTLEASFLGGTLGRQRGKFFSREDLKGIGRSICESISCYSDSEQVNKLLETLKRSAVIRMRSEEEELGEEEEENEEEEEEEEEEHISLAQYQLEPKADDPRASEGTASVGEEEMLSLGLIEKRRRRRRRRVTRPGTAEVVEVTEKTTEPLQAPAGPDQTYTPENRQPPPRSLPPPPPRSLPPPPPRSLPPPPPAPGGSSKVTSARLAVLEEKQEVHAPPARQSKSNKSGKKRQAKKPSASSSAVASHPVASSVSFFSCPNDEESDIESEEEEGDEILSFSLRPPDQLLRLARTEGKKAEKDKERAGRKQQSVKPKGVEKSRTRRTTSKEEEESNEPLLLLHPHQDYAAAYRAWQLSHASFPRCHKVRPPPLPRVNISQDGMGISNRSMRAGDAIGSSSESSLDSDGA